MARYKVETPSYGLGCYAISDEKTGSRIASFTTLPDAEDYVEFLNKKEEFIKLWFNQIERDIQESFDA